MRGDGHIKLAAAVEFMHTATLLHDDVVDESELRRGRLAARMLWGNEASVLVGDFLLGQAFKMMVEVGSLKALEILSSAAAVIAEGEVMQLAAAKNTATTEDEYIAVIRAKTAELFAAACEVGPAISGAAEGRAGRLPLVRHESRNNIPAGRRRARLRRRGAKLGKNIGDDFREGKITLPVVLAFRRGSDAEREFWRRTLERGETTDADLDHAIGLMAKHRALEDTIGRAHHYGAMARDALALFPDSPMKSALAETVDFCIARTHLAAQRAARWRAPTSADICRSASFAGDDRFGGRRKQRKAGGARARHARQPAAGKRAQRREHVGDRPAQARSRRLQDRSAAVARSCKNSRGLSACASAARSQAIGSCPAAGFQPANTDLVASATPGLTSTAGSGGRSSGAESFSPMPRISRGRGSRQTGTSAPVARAAS